MDLNIAVFLIVYHDYLPCTRVEMFSYTIQRKSTKMFRNTEHQIQNSHSVYLLFFCICDKIFKIYNIGEKGLFMRILGIDPGYAIVGYGVLDYRNNRFSVVDYGAITTEAGTPFNRRLEMIYTDLYTLMDRHRPEAMAIEKLFYNTNAKTVIDVAQARGVTMLAAQQHGLEIFEYTPLQVKQSVVGYGRAEKKQVQEMTRIILNLEKVPKPDDTADALAMAICHGHSSGSLMGKLNKMGIR